MNTPVLSPFVTLFVILWSQNDYARVAREKIKFKYRKPIKIQGGIYETHISEKYDREFHIKKRPGLH